MVQSPRLVNAKYSGPITFYPLSNIPLCHDTVRVRVCSTKFSVLYLASSAVHLVFLTPSSSSFPPGHPTQKPPNIARNHCCECSSENFHHKYLQQRLSTDDSSDDQPGENDPIGIPVDTSPETIADPSPVNDQVQCQPVTSGQISDIYVPRRLLV